MEKLEVVISQQDLETIAELRREIDWQRAELKRQENAIADLISVGAKAEPGRFEAHVTERPGRKHAVIRVVEHAVRC